VRSRSGSVTGVSRRTFPARRVLQYAYDAARNLPDRVLHRRRHRAALHRIARAEKPRTILVVCHGNICRSPYLHAVLQRDLSGIAVSSAGFFGSDRGVPEVAVTLGTARGLDLSQYRSRPLTQTTVAGADLIIVMDADQAHYLAKMFPVNRGRIVVAADLDQRFSVSRGITDPWNRSREVFESSFDRLDRCGAALVRALHERS
jgi:protein-tyrosine phosphatase